MSNVTINQLPSASTIDPVSDLLPIFNNGSTATQSINRNTLLNLASQPVGLSDSQTLTNKMLTSPTISGPTLSGTVTGTYTLGGTPTFPSTVVSTTGTQTLTNKTLTSPTINSPTITNATLSADTITGYTTSNTGSIYGISVTSGTIGSAALAANSVTNTAITSGALYTSKVYNPYKFNVYRSGALTPGASSTIVFDTKQFDTGSNYSTSTGIFTVPVSGFYFFSAQLSFNTSAANSAIYFELLNGSTVLGYSANIVMYASTGGNAGASISGIYQCTANDNIKVQNVNTSGFSLITGTGFSYFSGFLVSAT